jgi:hypothetical protein
LNTLPPGEAYLNTQFVYYQRVARDKGLPWEFSKEQFRTFVKAPCKYCGKDESKGIDRIDNFLGYVLSNCCPCCKTCNYAKNTMSEQDFVTWVERVHSNFVVMQYLTH